MENEMEHGIEAGIGATISIHMIEILIVAHTRTVCWEGNGGYVKAYCAASQGLLVCGGLIPK